MDCDTVTDEDKEEKEWKEKRLRLWQTLSFLSFLHPHQTLPWIQFFDYYGPTISSLVIIILFEVGP
jgi:hypothetical protein